MRDCAERKTPSLQLVYYCNPAYGPALPSNRLALQLGKSFLCKGMESVPHSEAVQPLVATSFNERVVSGLERTAALLSYHIHNPRKTSVRPGVGGADPERIYKILAEFPLEATYDGVMMFSSISRQRGRPTADDTDVPVCAPIASSSSRKPH